MNYRGASVVTLITLLNVMITSGNQIVLAFLFGAGASMDAFIACGAVPFVILNLAIGDLSYILIPLLMRYKVAAEQKTAIQACFSFIVWLALGVAAAGVLAHRLILLCTTSHMPPATFEIAASLAPYMWIIMGLTIIGSYLTGLHYHHRHFNLPAITLALPYLGMIAGGICGARYIGIRSVVFGWLAGTLLRDVVLYQGLGEHAPSFTVRCMHPATRLLMRRLGPLGASLLPFASLPLIDVFWASRLPVGSISFLGYGTRIVIALTSIVVQGVSVLLFPDLSADAAGGRYESLREKVRGALIIIFTLIVPLASLVFLVRLPLLTLLLQRGRFTAASSEGVAEILPYFLFGSVWMAMMNIVSRSFYALENYATPAKSGVVALVGYALLSGLLVGSYSFRGIGMAYICFWLLLFFFQMHLLRRWIGVVVDRRFLGLLVRVLLSGTVSICVVSLISEQVPEGSLRIAFETASFLPVFLVVATYLLRVQEYRLLSGRLFARYRRVPAAVA